MRPLVLLPGGLTFGLALVLVVACAPRAARPDPESESSWSVTPSPELGAAPGRAPSHLAIDLDAPCIPGAPLPCDLVRLGGRPRHHFPTLDEAHQLEALLVDPQLPTPERNRVRQRIAATYLEIACRAMWECLREEVHAREAVEGASYRRAVAAALAADVAGRYELGCSQLSDVPGSPCATPGDAGVTAP